MLRRLSDLEGYPIEATNGAIGQVTDFLFDDESWVVRYLVVQTGEWLSDRSVLISPIAIGQPAWSYRTLRVPMTTDQVRNSPDVDTNKPVSRQYELEYFDYYGYRPHYWGNSGLWGASDHPGALRSGSGGVRTGVEPRTVAADCARLEREVDLHRNDDPHLRSANAVMHYHINASDGGIGHVQGLLLDEDTWAIRYLIVDTSNWWLGHKVLIAPQWIQGVSWSERTVSINLSREAIKRSPTYDSTGPLHRHQEASLYNHYQRAGYWADHVKLQNPEFRTVQSAPPDLVGKHAQQ
jgi:sporulation protein YlmC with PRC-barrel domain